jgi:addiction module HigA family antidote
MSNLKREICPSYPGKILHEMFLVPRKIKVGEFANAVGLSQKTLSLILHGKASVTPKTSEKFARALGTTPELWLNLQKNVDLFDARQELADWKPSRTWSVAQAS